MSVRDFAPKTSFERAVEVAAACTLTSTDYVYHRDILAQSSLDIMRSTTPANGRYFYDRQATSASARSFHDRTDHQEDKHHTCEICGARIKGGESRLRTHKNRSEACKAIAEKQKRRGLTSGGSRDGHLAAKIIRKSDPSQKKIEIEGEEEEAEEDEEQMEKEDKSCANGTRMETDAMEVDDQVSGSAMSRRFGRYLAETANS